MNFALPFVLLLSLLTSCVGSDSKSTAGKESEEKKGEDVLASQAWHLQNVGQKSFAGSAGVSGEDFKIKEAIALGYTGKGIRVAVSDSGVDLFHPDLNDNSLTGYHRDYSSSAAHDWQGPSVDPYPSQNETHGTAVTGLIAAVGWNTIGSRGVSPRAKFAGFNFIGDFDDTNASYDAKTVDQIFGNFHIFNYSYGFVGCSFTPVDPSIVSAYKEGVTSQRNGKGAIYVKAAGNDFIGNNKNCYSGDPSQYLGNTNSNEDQNLPYLILAAAVNAEGSISSYSTPGSGVWISSAGGEFGYDESKDATLLMPAMVTTDLSGCKDGMASSKSKKSSFNRGKNRLNQNCDYTNTMNGTSSAAPTLSGMIALLLEANPALSWRDVKHILASTADKIKFSPGALSHPGGSDLASHTYDYLYVTNQAGVSFSNTYGFGRVNILAAINMAKNYIIDLGMYEETLDPNTDEWYYKSGLINLTIPDANAAGVFSNLTSLHQYVVEAVQVKVSIDHSYLGDLGVELVSPSGTRSKLLLINSNVKDANLTDYTLLTNAFYGERSQGFWQLKVIDGSTTDVGTLKKWSLKINGHKVRTSDTTPPLPVGGISHAPTELLLTRTPAVTLTPSPSGDVLRYEVAIGSLADDDIVKWHSIGAATSFQLTGLSLSAGTYSISVRTIDTSENISTTSTNTWQAGI